MTDNRKNVKVAPYVKAAIKEVKDLMGFGNESEVIAYLLKVQGYNVDLPALKHMQFVREVKQDHDLQQILIV